MKNWLTPIRILVIFLSILALGASISWAGVQQLEWLKLALNLGLLYFSSWVTFLVLEKVGWAKATRWEHRFITAVILFLLFDAGFSWWLFPILGVMSEASQRLIRVPTGPVFNPAALVATVGAVFGFYPGWWGVSFAPRIMILEPGLSVAVFLTIPIASYIAWKYRKLQIMGATLVTFSLAYLFILGVNPLFVLLEGTLAFFLLVMAVEPKTSPVLLTDQLVYGGVLGVLMVLAIAGGWREPNCMPLLLCNGGFNLYRNRKWLQEKLRLQSPK